MTKRLPSDWIKRQFARWAKEKPKAPIAALESDFARYRREEDMERRRRIMTEHPNATECFRVLRDTPGPVPDFEVRVGPEPGWIVVYDAAELRPDGPGVDHILYVQAGAGETVVQRPGVPQLARRGAVVVFSTANSPFVQRLFPGAEFIVREAGR